MCFFSFHLIIGGPISLDGIISIFFSVSIDLLDGKTSLFFSIGFGRHKIYCPFLT